MSVTDLSSHRAALAGGAFVRVVNWHNTPERGRARLRAELVAYLRDHRPVVPDDLDRLFETGRWGHDRPGLLVAFYDGYRNGATVAAPVCDGLGVTAWFMPPTGFLDTPAPEQQAYAAAHDIGVVAEEREQARIAMTWDELSVIGERHVVAAHTAHHTTLDDVVTAEDVEREVLGPIRRITEVTGRTPPAQVFRYGRPHAADSPGWQAAARAGVRYALSNTAVAAHGLTASGATTPSRWQGGGVLLGPLALRPLLVPKPWGARHLADLGRSLPDDVLVGESWDVADLDASQTAVPEPVTRVAHGPLTGATLADLVADHREELLGGTPPTRGGRFPLLVKHLDAGQHLSVQVHPSAAVVDDLPGAHLKTESWIVVQAEEGAQLMLGVADGVSPEQLEAALGTPAVVPLLRRVPARVGDVHHVPAGLLHALGAGVVVCEPQTPSDTTYRLYDWTQEYGRAPRDLHATEAMRCLRAEWDLNVAVPGPVQGDGVLVDTPHYRISRTTGAPAGPVQVAARTSARVVVVVEGSLSHPDLPAPLGPAGVCLLPAAWAGSLEAGDGTTWLDLDLV